MNGCYIDDAEMTGAAMVAACRSRRFSDSMRGLR